jgi:PhnB protein
MLKLGVGLRFPGTCEEAFKFYQSVFGGELFMLQRYKEMREHGYKIKKKDENNIAFVGLKVNEDFILGGDDFNPDFNQDYIRGSNFSLSFSTESKAEVERFYSALSEGGTEQTPPIDVYWGEYSGGVRDKYGILWYVNYHLPESK